MSEVVEVMWLSGSRWRMFLRDDDSSVSGNFSVLGDSFSKLSRSSPILGERMVWRRSMKPGSHPEISL